MTVSHLLHVIPQFTEDQHHSDGTSLNCMSLLSPCVDASSMDDPGVEEGGEESESCITTDNLLEIEQEQTIVGGPSRYIA